MDPGLEAGAAAEARAGSAAVRAALACAVIGGAVGAAGLGTVAAICFWVLPRATGLVGPLAPVLGVLGAGATLMLIGASGAARAWSRDGVRAAQGLRLLAIGAIVAGVPALLWAGHLAWFAWQEAGAAAPTPAPWRPPPPPKPWALLALTTLGLALPWGVTFLSGLTLLRRGSALHALPAGGTPWPGERVRRRRLLVVGALAAAALLWGDRQGYLSPPEVWGPATAVRALDRRPAAPHAFIRIFELGADAAPHLLARLERGADRPSGVAMRFGAWIEGVRPIVPALAGASIAPPLSEKDLFALLEYLGPRGAGVADRLLAVAASNPGWTMDAAGAIGAMGARAIPAVERHLADRYEPGALATWTLVHLLDDRDAAGRPGPVSRALVAPERTPRLRACVAEALALRGPAAVWSLLELLGADEAEVARAAAIGLERVADGNVPEMVSELAALVATGPAPLRASAARALLVLSPTQRAAALALARAWSAAPSQVPGAPGAPALSPDLLPGLRVVWFVAPVGLERRLGHLIAELVEREPASTPAIHADLTPPSAAEGGRFLLASESFRRHERRPPESAVRPGATAPVPR